MQVGIIGSGMVGQTLGKGFIARDYDVMIGTRNPEEGKLNEWLEMVGPKGSVGTFNECATFGDLIVIAIKGEAVEELLTILTLDDFINKLVIDVTNPLDFSQGMPPRLFTGPNDSLGERLQNSLLDAKVVKCWNIVPSILMVDPDINGMKPTMMYCGNDPDAKAMIHKILLEFGWDDLIDLGGIENARLLEGLLPLWATINTVRNSYNQAFKLLHD